MKHGPQILHCSLFFLSTILIAFGLNFLSFHILDLFEQVSEQLPTITAFILPRLASPMILVTLPLVSLCLIAINFLLYRKLKCKSVFDVILAISWSSLVLFSFISIIAIAAPFEQLTKTLAE